ncbi:MAG: HPr family phosphocarrier protein [Synergistaceae bacterium]|jgi:phosphocarrier protein|nr:HPr family phosphocarrier protein [Synergistaceae bacterium]
MYTRTVRITNPAGLHARSASELVRRANRFSSTITIGKMSDEKKVNAKSIVMVMSLGAAPGSEIELSAEGADEREAVDSLAQLLENGPGGSTGVA